MTDTDARLIERLREDAGHLEEAIDEGAGILADRCLLDATEAADRIESLTAALDKIREVVRKRQLPITNQVFEIADAALGDSK